MATPILSLDEISENQASKYITHNTALRALEALTIRVLDIRTTAPPGSPSDGDAYICGSSASLTAAWSTFTVNDIAFYNSGWYNLTPVEGIRLWVNDEDSLYAFYSSSWGILSTKGSNHKLASITADMQAGDGKTDLYTVPTGKSFIPTHVVIRNPSGSMAGGTDFSLGDGAAADNWIAGPIDLSGLGTAQCRVVTNNDANFTIYDAADVFGIYANTGATADVTATIDVFGYLH